MTKILFWNSGDTVYSFEEYIKRLVEDGEAIIGITVTSYNIRANRTIVKDAIVIILDNKTSLEDGEDN